MADLESIITSSVESAHPEVAAEAAPVAEETSTEVVSEETPAEEAAAEEAPAAAEEAPADAAPTEPEVPDLSAAELGGQTIPVSRHKAVLTKARKQAEAAQEKLKALEWAVAPGAAEKQQAIELADKNPELFADVLLADERFAAIFKSKFGATAAPAPVQKAAAETAAPTDKPQPDVLFPDGSVGYSAAAQEALIEWRVKDALKGVDERFAPVEKERKEAQELAVHRAEFERSVGTERMRIEHAKKSWPGYAQHEQAVKDYILAPGNERATLHDAYIAVVVPKLQSSEADLRKKILAEVNAAKPAAALARPGAPAAKVPGANRSIEDIILESSQALL